jgi:uncharacterized protein YndB with AHSA1/START domain
MPAPAKPTQTRSTFRMECATTIDVRATPERIWSLLTNAADFPRWSSTVTRLTGAIEHGAKPEHAVQHRRERQVIEPDPRLAIG